MREVPKYFTSYYCDKNIELRKNKRNWKIYFQFSQNFGVPEGDVVLVKILGLVIFEDNGMRISQTLTPL